jgi:hypothetical protein
MALATWWAADDMPQLDTLNGLTVATAADDEVLARINYISIAEVQSRRSGGHRPFIAYMNGVPAAYGWVATKRASIGELKLDFAIPADERYLWDFATVADWQGYGIYPRLLQAILRAEGHSASRFWIIYAPENLPSGAGMQKAGFSSVGQLSFTREGRVVLVPLDAPDRARQGANLLGVPFVEGEVSPCWRCVEKLVCSCLHDPAHCTCAIEVKPSLRQGASQ